MAVSFKMAQEHYDRCRAAEDAKRLDINRLEKIVNAERDALARIADQRARAFGELQMAIAAESATTQET